MHALQSLLAPWYIEIKFVHLTAVMAWVWSTSVAYIYYLVPAFKAWRRHPDDAGVVAVRDWVMDRFDRGAIIEHTAFPIVMISGPMLFIAGGWDAGASWLMLKLLIVLGLFVPIEVLDYHLSHFGGNKMKVLAQGGPSAREDKVHQHWLFLVVTTPLIVVFAMAVLFLAIVKPA